MKRVLDVVAVGAFFFALGIVGTVERGGDVRMMWWTIPALAVMAAAVAGRSLWNRKKYF